MCGKGTRWLADRGDVSYLGYVLLVDTSKYEV
jgi:hypothetical protein